MSLNALLLKAGMQVSYVEIYTFKGSCKVFCFSIARSPLEENVEYADHLKGKIGTRGCPIILME